MEERTFTFQLSSHDVDGLLPQVSRALEKRTELLSRRNYPSLWKLTDKCSAATKGRVRSRLRTRIMSIVCLALGVFLFVPGMMEPQELRVPLLAGAAAVGAGIGGLWRSRKHKKNPFDKASKMLLEGKDALTTEQPIVVSFSEEGMTLPADSGGAECVPYGKFECIIETADILLLVYGEAVAILQKSDLTAGDLDDLRAFLSEKVENYQSIT